MITEFCEAVTERHGSLLLLFTGTGSGCLAYTPFNAPSTSRHTVMTSKTENNISSRLVGDVRLVRV